MLILNASGSFIPGTGAGTAWLLLPSDGLEKELNPAETPAAARIYFVTKLLLVVFIMYIYMFITQAHLPSTFFASFPGLSLPAEHLWLLP